MVNEAVGLTLLIAGLVLITVELVHPGALLLLPGSVLFLSGILYLFLPDVLLDSLIGPFLIVVVLILAAIAQLAYYRWVAPVHRPLSTTSGGLVGETGVVIAPVVPHTLRGKVRVGSEIWSARADTGIPEGTMVRVVSGEGVSVKVVPLEDPRSAA